MDSGSSPPPSLEGTAKTTTETSAPKSPWARAVTWIGVTAIVVGGLLALWVYNGLRSLPGDVAATGREVLVELGNVAAAFRAGTVTTRFISHATEVSGNNYLQFATLRETEIFRHTDEATVLWGYLDLPNLVVEATAPVEYTYFLDLDERWELRLEGETIHVLAPTIRFNTPAVDASAIEYTVREGSLLRDETGAVARLKSGITRMARDRAVDNVDLVRELGRKETEEFVEGWLSRTFGDGARYRARVLFEDELSGPTPGETLSVPERERRGNLSLPPKGTP